MGIDGRIFPVSAIPQKTGVKKGEAAIFDEFMGAWYPIQVKQKDKVGRPDIDAFEAMMVRAERDKGVFAKGRTWCSRRPGGRRYGLAGAIEGSHRLHRSRLWVRHFKLDERCR